MSERERAARLCEKLADFYEKKSSGRYCCIGALRLAASRIRLDDDLAKAIGAFAHKERQRMNEGPGDA